MSEIEESVGLTINPKNSSNKSKSYLAILSKFKKGKEKTKLNAEMSQGSSLISFLNDTIAKLAR